MNVMNSFVPDVFERNMTLIAMNDKDTLATKEIQTSILLLLQNDLGKHALSEDAKAITKFTLKTPA
jgi:hypothetical protein